MITKILQFISRSYRLLEYLSQLSLLILAVLLKIWLEDLRHTAFESINLSSRFRKHNLCNLLLLLLKLPPNLVSSTTSLDINMSIIVLGTHLLLRKFFASLKTLLKIFFKLNSSKKYLYHIGHINGHVRARKYFIHVQLSLPAEFLCK